MRLDHVRVVLRPRSHWEAIDLGFMVARRWWRALWTAWLLCVLPLQLALTALLWWLADAPGAALVAVWWCKPVFDRVPLWVLSRGLFGEVPQVRAVLAALPSLLRRNLWTSLVWLRFDPARSFRAPVLDLEGLSGAAARHRRGVLSRGVDGAAGWLTVTCLCIDTAVQLGLIGALVLLIPDNPGTPTGAWALNPFEADMPDWVQWAWYVGTYLSMAAVEPLYVAAGFGLYLNRRTHLEGWDVELAFRRMSARLGARTGPSVPRVPLALLLAVALLPAWAAGTAVGQPRPPPAARIAQADPQLAPDGEPQPGEAWSETTQPGEAAELEVTGEEAAEVADADAAAPVEGREVPLRAAEWPQGPDPELDGQRAEVDRVIAQVAALPELGGKRRETVWRLKKSWEPEPEVEAPQAAPKPGVGTGLLGLGMEALLWGLFGLGAAFALVHLLMRVERLRLDATSPSRPVLQPLDGAMAAPALPFERVPQEAAALWRRGARTEALGVLYAGAVRHLDTSLGLEIPQGATEGDCLRAVRGAAPEPSGAFFASLVGAWRQAAYAHREPSGEDFEALVRDWPVALAAAASDGGRP